MSDKIKDWTDGGAKSWDELLAKREKKDREHLADLLVEAVVTAYNIDQLTWMDVEAAVEPLLEKLEVPPIPCGTCKKPISRLHYELGQGECGECIGKNYHPEEF